MLKSIVLGICFAVVSGSGAFAQGQDSTPAQRDIMTIGALLPGHYNNANQSYFDVRLKRPAEQRHAFVEIVVEPAVAPSLGAYAYVARYQNSGHENEVLQFVYALAVENDAEAVRMKTYALKKSPNGDIKPGHVNYIDGCDLLWRQEAGQFRATADDESCTLSKYAAAGSYEMLLTPDALWHSGLNVAPGFQQLDRSRNFECYIDVPGVGGGRDIPFERLELGTLHDLGGEAWATTKDGMEIGVNLFRVMWTFNNYEGVFARPSFVIYVKTKDENDIAKEVAYSFTSTDAQRIGLNLKWALASCYMLSNKSIKPFFKNDEPKVH